ncbi:hypothetical protein Q7C36_013688 [Tachysurus vachellii]|uniref:Uncharacterized protein n=1 Tax=Tachysurus vachellii TaxID=175792 RepID=A0AA88SH50_TACVA|nr:hypothetical protein Q7C36_013688 [Tachysurus vachellii]
MLLLRGRCPACAAPEPKLLNISRFFSLRARKRKAVAMATWRHALKVVHVTVPPCSGLSSSQSTSRARTLSEIKGTLNIIPKQKVFSQTFLELSNIIKWVLFPSAAHRL